MRAIKNTTRVKYKNNEFQGLYTYEIYYAPTVFEAQQWLKKHKVDRQFHYIIIETRQGNWGMDINGPYKEKKGGIPEPIEGNNVGKKCSNAGCSPALTSSLNDLKIGRSDKLITEMKCGLCEESSWVFIKPNYNEEQEAQCLYYGAINRISQQWQLHLI